MLFDAFLHHFTYKVHNFYHSRKYDEQRFAGWPGIFIFMILENMMDRGPGLIGTCLSCPFLFETKENIVNFTDRI